MEPLVSIWCTTYNHSEYIRDAVEGFLMQKTNFPYEIVIHDDASTDGTIDILKEYEEKYPDIIRVVYQKKNIFKDKNRIDIINQVKKKELRGKYVAFCDGDDCWIDSKKLQKQVDYLESNQECVMITHNAIWKNCKAMEDVIMNKDFPSGKIGIKELLYQWPVLLPTASIMIRNEYMYMSGFFCDCGVGDYPLKLYAVSYGYIYYMSEVMSIYRYMANGSWSSKTYLNCKEQILHCIKMIDFLAKYNVYTNKEYEKYVIVQINRYNSDILKLVKCLEEIELKELWEEINEETDYDFCEILEKVYQCYKSIHNEQLYIAQLKKRQKETEKIVLWGTGKFSNHYLECLEKHKLQIDGFVVSKRNEDNKIFLEKNVWEIQELLEDKRNYYIVVAVGLSTWAFVLDTIFEYDIKTFYSPFYYEIN